MADETYGCATDGAHVKKVALEGHEEDWETDAANAPRKDVEVTDKNPLVLSSDSVMAKEKSGKEEEKPIDYNKLK